MYTIHQTTNSTIRERMPASSSTYIHIPAAHTHIQQTTLHPSDIPLSSHRIASHRIRIHGKRNIYRVQPNPSCQQPSPWDSFPLHILTEAADPFSIARIISMQYLAMRRPVMPIYPLWLGGKNICYHCTMPSWEMQRSKPTTIRRLGRTTMSLGIYDFTPTTNASTVRRKVQLGPIHRKGSQLEGHQRLGERCQ